MSNLSEYTKGDRVEYSMHGQWYPSTVVKVTARRLVIRVDRSPKWTRNTVANQVRKIQKGTIMKASALRAKAREVLAKSLESGTEEQKAEIAIKILNLPSLPVGSNDE